MKRKHYEKKWNKMENNEMKKWRENITRNRKEYTKLNKNRNRKLPTVLRISPVAIENFFYFNEMLAIDK